MAFQVLLHCHLRPEILHIVVRKIQQSTVDYQVS
jgi:hypothetical protein